MANYSTLLKTWGNTGTEFPDGYSYLEGEQPVDAWDNFLIYNVIEDLDSLISTTNDRIETDKGGAGGEPGGPETAHLYHDSGNEALEFWDSTTTTWHRLLAADGDTLEGALDFAGFAAQNVGPMDLSGVLDVNGQDVEDAGTTIYDTSTGQFSDADTVDGKHASDLGSGVSDSGTLILSTATDLNFASNLSVTDDGDGTATVDASQSSDTRLALKEDGTSVYTQDQSGGINFTGHLNVIDDGNGSVTIDPTHNHDSRYYTESESDSNFAASGHTHDGRYYTESESDSNFAASGHNHDSRYVNIDSGGAEIPGYSTLSNVPTTLPEGTLVYVSDEDTYYYEDGN